MLASENKKEFPMECKQVEFMDKCIIEIRDQLNTVLQIIIKEKKTNDLNHDTICQIFNEFSNECQKFSNEPSHLFYITQIVFSETASGLKQAKDIFINLYNELYVYLPDLINDINGLRSNLYDNSNRMMSEIVGFINAHKNIQDNYLKIKANLDEAQMNKKKIDSDPKYAYNISTKEKAENKVIMFLKEMEQIYPKIQKFSDSLSEKKKRFNSTMRDNLELIVTNTFKYLANLHQVFFLYSKNKYDQFNMLLDIFKNQNNNMKSTSINLNDYSERKFGELQGIKYDGIDMIDLEDELLKTNPNQLMNTAKSIINYTNVFLLCIRYRKKVMKIFKKKFPNFFKEIKDNYEYILQEKKKLMEFVSNLKLIGEGTKKSWNIFFSVIIDKEVHSEINEVFKITDEIITETRTEYYSFLNIWKKYEKKINEHKDNIKELDNTLFQERKLKASQNLNNSNSKVGEKLKNKAEKLLNILKETTEFLNNNIPNIREKDSKLINKLIDCFSNINKIYENEMNKLINMTQEEIEISTSLDLFDECVFLFSKYFQQFNITNYESFMEKIKMKILLKTDFQKEKIGQSTYEQLNDFSGLNNTSFFDKRDNNNSKIIFNDSSSSISEQTKEKEIMIVKDDNEINTDKNIENPISPILKTKIDYNSTNNKTNIQQKNELKNLVDNLDNQENNNSNKNNINNSNNLINLTEDENNIKEDELKEKEENKETLNKLKNRLKEKSNSLIFSLEDESIDLIKQEKFENYLEKKNPYQNFKEPELKELKEKAFNKTLSSKKTIQNEEGETIIDSFSCAYKDKILLQGKLILTNKKIVFESLFNPNTLFGKGGTKLIIPLEKIKKVSKKSNLKIFQNSIEIETDKGVLFFTSFLFRNQCYNLIMEQLKNVINDKKDDEDKKEEEENNLGDKNSKFTKLKLKKSKQITKLLQEIDFYNRIDKIHNERLELFNKTYYDQKAGIFIPIDKFPQKYIDNEPLENCPLSIVFTYLWNPYTPIEEYEHNKGFYESILIDRNDIDIQFNDMKDDENNIDNVPQYFSDNEFTLSLLSNFNKDDLDKFIKEIETWKHIYQYTYKYIHPIKKYFIGPDRVGENDNIKIYFISPKLLVVDLLSKGSDFPYCDTFIPITQYRFETELKFNEKKGKFEFHTTFSCYFIVHILASSMFQSTLESTGYSQAHDSIKFNFFEKMKTICENQSELFIEMFNKISDETIQRKINQKENFIEGIDDNENDDDDFDEDDEDKNEIQIVKQVVSYDIKGDPNKFKKFTKVKNAFVKYQMFFIFGFIFCLLFGLIYLGVKKGFLTWKNLNFNIVLNIFMFGVIIYLILKNKK